MTGVAQADEPSEAQIVDGATPNWRESDEDYCHVVLKVDGRVRIIECRDGIQWIIQRRVSSNGATRARWRGVKYHRTRETLLVALASLRIDLTPDQRAAFDALPEWVEGGST